jgi:hypothetical protein
MHGAHRAAFSSRRRPRIRVVRTGLARAREKRVKSGGGVAHAQTTPGPGARTLTRDQRDSSLHGETPFVAQPQPACPAASLIRPAWWV